MKMVSETLDMAVLDDLKSIDGVGPNSVFHDVLHLFLTSADTELKAILLALKAKDSNNVWNLAHKFKSSCLTVGARRMGEICQSLENFGKLGDLSQAEPLGQMLVQSFAEVKPAVQDLIKQVRLAS